MELEQALGLRSQLVSHSDLCYNRLAATLPFWVLLCEESDLSRYNGLGLGIAVYARGEGVAQ
jgi:hypothetical protein